MLGGKIRIHIYINRFQICSEEPGFPNTSWFSTGIRYRYWYPMLMLKAGQGSKQIIFYYPLKVFWVILVTTDS
jgi:hypothetical protein